MVPFTSLTADCEQTHAPATSYTTVDHQPPLKVMKSPMTFWPSATGCLFGRVSCPGKLPADASIQDLVHHRFQHHAKDRAVNGNQWLDKETVSRLLSPGVSAGDA